MARFKAYEIFEILIGLSGPIRKQVRGGVELDNWDRRKMAGRLEEIREQIVEMLVEPAVMIEAVRHDGALKLADRRYTMDGELEYAVRVEVEILVKDGPLLVDVVAGAGSQPK